MNQLIKIKSSCAKNWEQKERSKAIREIALAYEEGVQAGNFDAFIKFMEESFKFSAWPSGSLEVSTSQYSRYVSEFATRAFSGIFFSKAIMQNSKLKNQKVLTLDLLREHYIEDDFLMDHVKELIVNCIQTHFSSPKLEISDKAPKVVFTGNANEPEFCETTLTDLLKKYGTEISLEVDKDTLIVEVEAPKYSIYSGVRLFNEYLSLLENLVKKEKYTLYKDVVESLLTEFRHSLFWAPDQLFCEAADVLKNAYDLIFSSEECLNQNVQGRSERGNAQLKEQPLRKREQAFECFTNSVNKLMESPALARERKKNIMIGCLGIAALIVAATCVAVALTLLAPFTWPFATLMAIGGMALGSTKLTSAWTFSMFTRTGFASCRSLESRFKNTGLFAKKVEGISRNTDEDTCEARPVCKAV